MAVWEQNPDVSREPPGWLLTGHMLLWNDGSPAHVRMDPFRAAGDGWEAALTISRSARDRTRWLPLVMKMTPEVRGQWDAQGTSQRARALQSLANYLRLTEWYQDDLGVLELK